MRFLTPFFALLSLSLCGCSSWPLSSKWAMNDPDYAEKYSQPYGDDKPVRMLKQMVDARHLDEKSGWTVGGGAGGSPATAGGTLGGFYHMASWLELDYALTGMAGTGAQDWFIGPEVGLRVQPPTRIAPFAGVGGFLGINRFYENADLDGVDNDDDGFADEFGEQGKNYKAFTAVYPEFGVHAWLTGKTRLTASARYYITEEGRDDDFWFVGFSISRLFGPGRKEEQHVWTDDEMPYAEPAEVLTTDGRLHAIFEKPVEQLQNDPATQAGYEEPAESGLKPASDRKIELSQGRRRIIDFYDDLSIADETEQGDGDFKDAAP